MDVLKNSHFCLLLNWDKWSFIITNYSSVIIDIFIILNYLYSISVYSIVNIVLVHVFYDTICSCRGPGRTAYVYVSTHITCSVNDNRRRRWIHQNSVSLLSWDYIWEPKADTICCGQIQQHLREYRDAICDCHILLWTKATTFETVM